MTAMVHEVEKALFLRKFGVPFWALSHVFGRDHMYWYRVKSKESTPSGGGFFTFESAHR
jgi:hypothetical protein